MSPVRGKSLNLWNYLAQKEICVGRIFYRLEIHFWRLRILRDLQFLRKHQKTAGQYIINVRDYTVGYEDHVSN